MRKVEDACEAFGADPVASKTPHETYTGHTSSENMLNRATRTSAAPSYTQL